MTTTSGSTAAAGTTRLTAGELTAETGAQGAALRSLRHGDRELLVHVDGPVAQPPFAGAVLAPWPNRVADARWEWQGTVQQLPVTEPDRGTALHGLALWEQWRVAEQRDDAVTYEHTLWPRPGYPFVVGLRAAYVLAADGLRLTVSATNRGDGPAPVGLAAHPYFVADGYLDDWTLRLPCASVIVTDERLLPRDVVPVGGVGLDFRTARPFGADDVDHAFTDVAFDADGRAAAELTGPDGRGVRLSWDTTCRWVQVYTHRRPGDPLDRRAVAIEPMTCAPDALNSGDGLVVLDPGATLDVTTLLEPVG